MSNQLNFPNEKILILILRELKEIDNTIVIKQAFRLTDIKSNFSFTFILLNEITKYFQAVNSEVYE